MIAREWRCRCPKDTRDAFIEYLHKTGIKDTQRTLGCKGAQLLQRELSDCVEITLLTYWDSMQSVVRFRGNDYESAQLYPDDYAYGIMPDHEVTHYEVLEVLNTQYIPGE